MAEIHNRLKAIVFRLGDEDFGVDVAEVRTIERMQEITHIPKAPHFVKGVINLRGAVIPVIDLRERLQFEATQNLTDTRLIVVRVKGTDIALIVDSAHDVIDIDKDDIAPPPTAVGGVQAVHLRGVAKTKDKLLVLLNLEHVLDDQEAAEVHAAIAGA